MAFKYFQTCLFGFNFQLSNAGKLRNHCNMCQHKTYHAQRDVIISAKQSSNSLSMGLHAAIYHTSHRDCSLSYNRADTQSKVTKQSGLPGPVNRAGKAHTILPPHLRPAWHTPGTCKASCQGLAKLICECGTLEKQPRAVMILYNIFTRVDLLHTQGGFNIHVNKSWKYGKHNMMHTKQKYRDWSGWNPLISNGVPFGYKEDCPEMAPS